jgi:uncharacterized membrane protein YgcG
MVAQVISFFQRAPRSAPAFADWTQQELAEFYRVESALIRAGIRVGTDRGMSDENEPWFCFYRLDDGEVVIHFARIDGEYLIAGPAYEEIARGIDFTALVRNMVASHPLIRRNERGSNISIHPAALLIAVVGTAFFKTGEARAAESGAGNHTPSHSRPALLQSSSGPALIAAPGLIASPSYDTAQLPANQAVLILAAALFASEFRAETTAETTASRTALAAAAAALDFSGSTPLATSDTTTELSGLGHAMVVDNTPAQTISSVLALTALLSTMPSTTEASPSEIISKLAAEASHDATGFGVDHGVDPQMAPQWALEVRLAWANAPNVEAVQLVRSLADGAPQKISVIEVEKLPDILADLIAKGAHYAVTPTAPPQTGNDTPIPPTDNDGSIGGGGGGGHDGGGGSGDGGNGGGGGNDSGGAAPADPALPPFAGFATQELVRQFIDYFVAHTSNVEIMTSGMQVTIYDTRVTHNASAIEHLTSMTFNFFDGSSVNLIGDHSSFLHGGVLV